MDIKGDLVNVKTHIQEKLMALYELTVPIGQLSTRELNERMLEITEQLGREVAVYISRQGRILQVALGDAATVDLPQLKQKTRSDKRLSGIRCIHTHPTGDVRLSEPDLSSLRRLRFDCMAAIGKRDGRILGSIGVFSGETQDDGTPGLLVYGPAPDTVLHQVNLSMMVTAVNKKLSEETTQTTDDRPERAVLAGVERMQRGIWGNEESMDELERLAETAGAVVVGRFSQRRERPDSALFLGKGKVNEIAMEIQNLDADLLILDDELTPSQQHNLERMLGIRVIDRTALILDIFAQRARLSRLGGGIGTRGPGETKLEVDRRRIHTRIHDIEEQINGMKKTRALYRTRRQKSRMPLVALVGYTNAGKSTLLNRLTGADVFAEDKLFATLDPTTRRLELPEKQEILLTDTVGFIQKLPHTLVTAFRATLEEVTEADLLLHVVDAGNSNAEPQIEAVIEVLKELGADEKPTLFVFNKTDCVENEYDLERLTRYRDAVCVSAATGANIDILLNRIECFFKAQSVEAELLVPYSDGAVITELHALNAVKETEYVEDGTKITASIPEAEIARFEKYMVKK